ncbi:hypothetical protein ACWD4O_46145 [Streptomyces sp. NPDC002623]
MAGPRVPAHLGQPVETLAARLGGDPADLTSQQLDHWLTAQEQTQLDRREILIRIMVRSARMDGAWTAWPGSRQDAGPLLNEDLDTGLAVADALATNAAAEAADARRSVDHLDPARIEAHLLITWQLPAQAEPPARDAAAQDRAFRDFAAAMHTARNFYLGAATAPRSPADGCSTGGSASPRTLDSSNGTTIATLISTAPAPRTVRTPNTAASGPAAR